MLTDQTAISATLTLESRCLRASLRLEVSHVHPSFSPECFLFDLHKSAEATFPVALATVAPPALRQILEEAEALLIQRLQDDRASYFSSEAKQSVNDTTGGDQQ